MSAKSKTFVFGDENGNEVSVTAKVGKIRRAQAIYDAANDEGTIQASDARDLFSRPENHSTMSLSRAFSLAGFELKGGE
jgi:major membrane immunogen (membrane-anchored lipoprotein)